MTLPCLKLEIGRYPINAETQCILFFATYVFCYPLIIPISRDFWNGIFVLFSRRELELVVYETMTGWVKVAIYLIRVDNFCRVALRCVELSLGVYRIAKESDDGKGSWWFATLSFPFSFLFLIFFLF